MPRPPRNKTVHFHAQIPRSHHALMRDTPLVRDFFVTMGGYGRDIQHPFENPYPHGMEDSLFQVSRTDPPDPLKGVAINVHCQLAQKCHDSPRECSIPQSFTR